ncbi:MAG TPA: THUMP domain-containing protein [Polyangiaceae bacterium]|jgi:putative N6-adenine-specific DNA methylase|nr:THUMP domain-containing protein [Polyangiaceae bacterium]
MRLFATAAKGTEPALRDELRELRLRGVRADRGGVHFEGDAYDAARACLWSRIAGRILAEVGSFEARDAEALYDGIREVDWTQWMTARTTLAVRATCRSSRLTHSQFIVQKTKDAVVDALRDRLGARPSVSRDDPDVGIAVHLAKDVATVYLDAGGASLHERGWRARTGEAPLRENLAAAVVRLSGWDRARPFLDPMCGAGTLAIEAAGWAYRVAPGLTRERFGFERWVTHDDEARARLRALRQEARDARLREGPAVYASDIDEASVQRTRENAREAGVEVIAERRDVRSLPPLSPAGTLAMNPPYGERLQVAGRLYEEMARSFRELHGHEVAILAGTPAIERSMGRRADKWWILYNGPIECRLLLYAMR